jgi:hypothetical protein
VLADQDLPPAAGAVHVAVRAGADGGKEIEDSVLRRLTIDLSLEDGEGGTATR